MRRPLHRQSSGGIGFLVALFLVLVVALLTWSQRQAIYDWSRLRDYEPPDQIAQLAFDTTMNNSARQLFYVHHPQLNDREDFNANCSGFGEHTIVLGCYVSHQGIYLFDIDDPRLQGVEQVTAAHEMLHAAYDRLSTSERTHVNDLTEEAFATVADERVKQSIANYRKREPGVVPNELHSIIATEVRNIPPELEAYYKKYFTDRSAIVAFSEKYESLLTARQNKASSLEVQIAGLKQEIEQLEATLATQQRNLERDRPTVNTQPEITAFNARVITYNHDVRTLNNMISQYNALIKEYKEVALEAQDLYKALDSRPTL